MERTTRTTDYSVEPARTLPVGKINPSELTKVLGSIINLDARGSYSDDGSALSYAWEFSETPLGSKVTGFTYLEEDNSVVSFVPDVTGQYTISMVVSTSSRIGLPVTATIYVQAAVVPYTAQLTPDAKFFWDLLSDFWKLVNKRECHETLWSGYIQSQASDLLRLFQVDYAKSIATIQPLFQRRWLSYSPRLDLDAARTTVVFGYEQKGTSAFTVRSGLGRGIIVSDREFILYEGVPTPSAIGKTLRVLTSYGGNVGDYTINRLNSDNSGYIVSLEKLFPDPTGEVVAASNDLLTYVYDDEVRSTAVDFVVAGVLAGDILRIEGGADVGYYTITAVGTPDGLINDRTLRLEKRLSSAKSNLSFSIFRSSRAHFSIETSPLTDTVYIPQPDLDPSLYRTATILGDGTLESPYEISVEPRHVVDAYVGKTIRFGSGVNSGKQFTIAGVNTSRTGFVLGSPLLGPFPSEVTYEIPLVTDISSRLLLLEGRAYKIRSISLDETQPPISDGGRGPLWVLSLQSSDAPSGREGLSWQIADSLLSDDLSVDYEKLGVKVGDLLHVEVQRVDTQDTSHFSCKVLGAKQEIIAFELGTDGSGDLDDMDIYTMALELKVPRVAADPITNALVYTYTADEIRILLNSLKFRKERYNLPFDPDTPLSLDVFSIYVRPSYVIRNSRIPIDESIVSIPALLEYIARPEVGEDADGNIVLVGKDSTEKILQRVPYVLLENRDYEVGGNQSISSDDAVTEAGSDLIRLPFANLLDRDVHAGDEIDLTSGFDQQRYQILEVVDDEYIRVLSSAGVPEHSAEEVHYRIHRNVEGTFLRLVSGIFSPQAPAPERFWAETTLFDNSDYIEDNFGVLVNITKEQLDEYGSSQVTYKGVISGLMYAWTMGPTLQNAEIGAHLLLGLPVTEVLGRVVDVSDSYSPGVGRIMVEDVNQDGQGTGLVRIYFYASTSGDVLPEFAGLSINPTTGLSWALNDMVPPFTALSNGTIVSDYISDPDWWRKGENSGAEELKKFHTWQVEMDVLQIDSRDISLVADYLSAMRPIYTKPEIVAVLFLEDEVTIEDSLTLDGNLFLFDEPYFSLQSTKMGDDVRDLSLRTLDTGSLSTRVLFRGDDLVTAAGSNIVSSVRGGFFLGSGGDFFLPYINEHFQDEVVVRGMEAVRAGDILHILQGPNSGRYEIDNVFDDNTVRIKPLSAMAPRTHLVAEIVEETGQPFYIERLDTELVITGKFLHTTIGSYEVYDFDAKFNWDGVAVDDKLLIKVGPAAGIYTVVRVGHVVAGTLQDLETYLLLEPPLAGTAIVGYTIVRESLKTNPLFVGHSFTLGQIVSVIGGGLTWKLIRPTDEIHFTSGPNVGETYKILDVVTDAKLAVFPAPAPGVGDFEIIRPMLGESYSPLTSDSDSPLERIGPQEMVEWVILRPQVVFLALVDLGLFVNAATSAATDLQLAGVTTDMTLEIDPAHQDCGVYELGSVVGFTATTIKEFPIPEGPVVGNFLQDVADFTVNNDIVTSAALFDYEAQGIIPGDILRLSFGDFVIMDVSTFTLTLTKTTGVIGALVTGKIIRKVWPT